MLRIEPLTSLMMFLTNGPHHEKVFNFGNFLISHVYFDTSLQDYEVGKWVGM
jgi:hypothetical protein